jgi:hypothetical protein
MAGSSAEVSHLVSSLLGGLDDGARGLLAAASVLGTEFDAALAAAVCEADQGVTGMLSAAEAGGLVTRRPSRSGTWRFTHALVRDGIYASLSDGQRTALHGPWLSRTPLATWPPRWPPARAIPSERGCSSNWPPRSTGPACSRPASSMPPPPPTRPNGTAGLICWLTPRSWCAASVTTRLR